MTLVTVIVCLLSILLYALVFFNFTKPKNRFFASHISLIAHRGGFADCAVENSCASIEQNLKKGIEAFEIDLQHTKDDHVVVFHDDDLKRLASLSKKVESLTLKDLERITLTQGKFTAKIETFEKFLHLQAKYRFKTILDVKPCHNNYKLAKEVYRLVKQHNLLDLTCITSFSPVLLFYFRIFDKNLILSMSVERETNSVLARLFYRLLVDFVAKKLGLSFLLIQADLLSLDFIRRKAAQGLQVLPWTINDPVEKAAYKKHNIGYLTDNPD